MGTPQRNVIQKSEIGVKHENKPHALPKIFIKLKWQKYS